MKYLTFRLFYLIAMIVALVLFATVSTCNPAYGEHVEYNCLNHQWSDGKCHMDCYETEALPRYDQPIYGVICNDLEEPFMPDTPEKVDLLAHCCILSNPSFQQPGPIP